MTFFDFDEWSEANKMFTPRYERILNLSTLKVELVEYNDYYDAIQTKSLNRLLELAKHESIHVRERVVKNPYATEAVKRLVFMTDKKLNN